MSMINMNAMINNTMFVVQDLFTSHQTCPQDLLKTCSQYMHY